MFSNAWLSRPNWSRHMNSWRYQCSIDLWQPIIALIRLFFWFQYDSMCWVCTRVTGSTKFIEWLTVRWVRPNPCMFLYALHSSLCTIDPGRTTFWIIGSRVAASRLSTISINPIEGVVEVSTRPKTHNWTRNNFKNDEIVKQKIKKLNFRISMNF